MSDPIAAIPMMRITPSTGVSPASPAGLGEGADFGAALRSAVESAVDTGHEAEAASMKAITQGGNVTDVVTALSRAELTLQTATAVRDRMLQAYQDIMRIQI
jgi:flagellar hook-basal body complex protein FliE